ncbi:CHAT domain-containing protein [Kribbella sp. VKM Ac-2569]|uniref:CHAT domain-containing protein n=1 Tax=Kribbella sp. VKM Ac-2569 TaxID=2512220 RepID=UPI00130064FE|nr:CHAT domain-containing protein [Kribbella sp. VKM Ac-2569]
MEPTVCTLTIKDDYRGEYEDNLRYVRSEGRHVLSPLGAKRLTRAIVQLLHGWIAASPQCKRAELKVLGSALYEIAFGELDPADPTAAPMRAAFEDTLRTCNKVDRPVRLRLVVESTAQTLGQYPWEFLYLDRGDDESGFFLAGQDVHLTLTRYVPNEDTWAQAPEDQDGRLRVLVVVSRPRIPDMTDLKVGGFVEQLMQLDHRRFVPDLVPSPTRAELRKRIRALQPHVIHFIGHGRANQIALKKDAEVLARDLEDYSVARELGRLVAPVSEADWVDAFTACGILRAGLERRDAPQRLIFLHACEGATVADTDNILEGLNSVARALMGGNGRIGGVIAMQYTIAVEEAELFAKFFYDAISKGQRVDEAVRSARMQFAETPLRASQQSWDNRGWGTPVIFLRSEDPLVQPPPTLERAKEPCPNPSCPDGWVIRAASLKKCRRCQYPFVECPACPNGLVVPKSGFECSECDYIFESAKTVGPADAPDAVHGRRRRPAERRDGPLSDRLAASMPRDTNIPRTRTTGTERREVVAGAGGPPHESADDVTLWRRSNGTQGSDHDDPS